MSAASTYTVDSGTIDELIHVLQEIRKQYGNVVIHRLDTDWGTDPVEHVSYDHQFEYKYQDKVYTGGWVIT